MAQLARACVLHTQGYRFDPDYLQLILEVFIIIDKIKKTSHLQV
jgi:hypothetical protein